MTASAGVRARGGRRLVLSDARAVARIGLWVLVFTFPMQKTISIGAISALSKGVGVIVAPIALAAVLTSGRRAPWRDFEQATALFTAVAAASLVWTVDTSATLEAVGSMVQMLALVLLVRELAPGRDGVRGVAVAYIAGCWVPVLQSLYGGLTDAALVDGRLRVGEVHPNDLAFSLTLALPLAWWLATTWPRPERRSARSHRILRRSMYVFIPFALYAIVLTGSRSGLLISGIALLAAPWALAATDPRRAIGVLVLVLAASPFVVSILPAEQTERLATSGDEIASGTLNNRTTLWSAAFDIWGDHVVTGVGAGASREEIADRSGIALRAHSTPLSVAAELGVVGLVPFGLCFLIAIRRSLATSGATRRMTVTLSATLIIGLLVRHWDYEKPTWLVLALLAAVASSSEPTEPPGPGPTPRTSRTGALTTKDRV